MRRVTIALCGGLLVTLTACSSARGSGTPVDTIALKIQADVCTMVAAGSTSESIVARLEAAGDSLTPSDVKEIDAAAGRC